MGLVGDLVSDRSGRRQAADRPGGRFGEDGVIGFCIGPDFELRQELRLAAIADGDGDVAEQSAAFCSLYG